MANLQLQHHNLTDQVGGLAAALWKTHGKKQKKCEIQGTTMENAQDLRENHRKNMVGDHYSPLHGDVYHGIPHGLRHTMTRPDDSGLRPWATPVAGEFQICSSPCRRSLRISRHANRIPVNPSVYWSFWLFWPFQADPICLPLRFGVAGVSALAAANSHPRVSVCGAERWDCHCPNLWRSEKRSPALWRCGGGAQHCTAT